LSAQFPAKLEPLFKPARYKVLWGGRGGAKSWGVARALLIQGAAQPLRILCAREIQRTISDSVHRLISDQIRSLGLEAHYRILETEIRGVNGTQFIFAGLRTQDIAKIKSLEGIDRVWCEEAQTISKKSWDVLIPTIRKPGSEIWITFNPELDTDETYLRFVVNPLPGSILININYSDNPWFPEELERERLHLKEKDPEAYDNVWEGRCRSSVEGAIYKREISDLVKDGRIRNVPRDPLLKVHTVWDLGWNDQMSIILAQRLGAEIRIIDYIEDSHKTLAEYVAMLQERKWNWGTDWLPHDGEARDYKTGKSAQEILRSLGRSPMIVPKTDVESGIKAARLVFPRCYFDQAKTERLVNCLKRYRRAIPVSTNEPAAPLHDEYSHAADAFRYLSLIVDRMVNEDMKPLKYEHKGVV
jgi:phage terminase large subunit